VAQAFQGDDLDNPQPAGIKNQHHHGPARGLPDGRGRAGPPGNDGDGPHLIYLPERPITREQFRDEVAAVYKRLGRCIVAVSEGIVDAAAARARDVLGGHEARRSRPFVERVDAGVTGIRPEEFDVIRCIGGIERDSHNNIQLSGSGMLGELAGRVFEARAGQGTPRQGRHARLSPALVPRRGQPDRPGRGAPVRPDGRALCDAEGPGRHRVDDPPVRRPVHDRVPAVPLSAVARRTRSMPDTYITTAGNDVTQAFLD